MKLWEPVGKKIMEYVGCLGCLVVLICSPPILISSGLRKMIWGHGARIYESFGGTFFWIKAISIVSVVGYLAIVTSCLPIEMGVRLVGACILICGLIARAVIDFRVLLHGPGNIQFRIYGDRTDYCVSDRYGIFNPYRMIAVRKRDGRGRVILFFPSKFPLWGVHVLRITKDSIDFILFMSERQFGKSTWGGWRHCILKILALESREVSWGIVDDLLPGVGPNVLMECARTEGVKQSGLPSDFVVLRRNSPVKDAYSLQELVKMGL